MTRRLGYIALTLSAAACGAPGYSNSESTYTPSEYHAASSASSEYNRDVGGKGVYEGLYENPAATSTTAATGLGSRTSRLGEMLATEL